MKKGLFESMSLSRDLIQCKERFGWSSKDPSWFSNNLQALTFLAFDLTWRDIYIVITTSCTPKETQSGRQLNSMENKYQFINWIPMSEEPKQSLTRTQIRIIIQLGNQRRDHMVSCLLGGMRKCIKKPTNYEKVKGITRERWKLSLFPGVTYRGL